MAGVTFTVELQDAAAAALRDLVGRMSRPIGFFKSVGEYLTQIAIPRNFANQSSPDGIPWAQLSSVTIARRAAKGVGPTPILQVTRRLAASVVSQPDDQGVTVGSPVPYAAVMQGGAAQGQFGTTGRGGPIPWGNIPARPYLGLSAADEAEIIAIASDWLQIEGSP